MIFVDVEREDEKELQSSFLIGKDENLQGYFTYCIAGDGRELFAVFDGDGGFLLGGTSRLDCYFRRFSCQ